MRGRQPAKKKKAPSPAAPVKPNAGIWGAQVDQMVVGGGDLAALPIDQYLDDAAAEIGRMGTRLISQIVDIGAKLVEVKERVGHGKYESFVRDRLKLSPDSALNFIRSFELTKSRTVRDLTIAPSALYLIAAPSTPPEARDRVLEKAATPEGISSAEAKRIVAEAKKPLAAERAARELPEHWCDRVGCGRKFTGDAPPGWIHLIAIASAAPDRYSRTSNVWLCPVHFDELAPPPASPPPPIPAPAAPATEPAPAAAETSRTERDLKSALETLAEHGYRLKERSGEYQLLIQRDGVDSACWSSRNEVIQQARKLRAAAAAPAPPPPAPAPAEPAPPPTAPAAPAELIEPTAPAGPAAVDVSDVSHNDDALAEMVDRSLALMLPAPVMKELYSDEQRRLAVRRFARRCAVNLSKGVGSQQLEGLIDELTDLTKELTDETRPSAGWRRFMARRFLAAVDISPDDLITAGAPAEVGE